MKRKDFFIIPFAGLKEGLHYFSFSIKNKFFKSFGYNDFNNAKLIANVNLIKKVNLLELNFIISGKVNVFCDISIEPFDIQINTNSNCIVKFGNPNENIHALQLEMCKDLYMSNNETSYEPKKAERIKNKSPIRI